MTKAMDPMTGGMIRPPELGHGLHRARKLGR